MPTRPHIILLMADHLRADCLSCYGKLGVRTPHLDGLAQQSVVFDRAYCSTPLCVPTRTSMATGLWPHTTGVIVNGGRFEPEIPFRELRSGYRTYYEQLAEGGYPITHVGVQHVHSHPPLERRVPQADINSDGDVHDALRAAGFAVPGANEWWKPVPEWCDGRPMVRMSASPMFVQTTPFAASLYPDHVYADRMVRRIEQADPGTPRFWVFQLWAPHPPLWVPEPYASMYNPADIDLPPTVGRWRADQPAHLMLGSGSQGSQFMPDDWRRTWAAYFGLTTLVDDCLGKVIAAFRRAGIWDDAMALFVQDHGENLGCHGLYQKFTMHETSARVPLLIKPPGNAAGQRRSQPVGHIDIANTFCDYAGLDPMPGSWGSSLRPLVERADAPWRDVTFSEYHGDHGRAYPTRAVMTSRYKYIDHFGHGTELYDVLADEHETHNLAQSPQHAPLVQELRQRLRQWMAQTGDPLDLDRHADFHPAMWRDLGPAETWGRS